MLNSQVLNVLRYESMEDFDQSGMCVGICSDAERILGITQTDSALFASYVTVTPALVAPVV